MIENLGMALSGADCGQVRDRLPYRPDRMELPAVCRIGQGGFPISVRQQDQSASILRNPVAFGIKHIITVLITMCIQHLEKSTKGTEAGYPRNSGNILDEDIVRQHIFDETPEFF